MDITIQQCLTQLAQQYCQESETPVLDAQVLLSHHLEKSRSWVLAHPDEVVSPPLYEIIKQSAHRIKAGEPLPYVLGHWEFYGLDFIISPDVLIPRPETELLVERAISWLKLHPHQRKIVDVGTGSGCIGISIAKNVSDVNLVMTDISSKALVIARRNAGKHGLQVNATFKQTSLLEDLPGPFDLICANLPYIPTPRLENLQVAYNEPRLALDGGEAGISLIVRLLEQAKGKLKSGGLMLLEIDDSENNDLQKLAGVEYPQSRVDMLQDLSGKARCLEIERPSRIVHLCTPEEWLGQHQQMEFRDLSLIHDGFIHCSQPEQIIDIANRYYQDKPEIVVLWIDPEKVASEIRWEQTGDIFYPHIYGPINMKAIDAATPIHPAQDGVYRTIFS
jgi:release factor glutamine methyltransferase